MRSHFKSFLGSIVLLTVATEASSYPEMIKSGYHACRACHYDPGGGGQINAYGRTILAEHISRWSRRDEAEAFWGLVNLRPVDVAADVRHVYYRTKSPFGTVSGSLWMQREVGVAVNVADNVAVVGTGGLYGESEEVAFRTYYASARFEGLSLRAGRFLPAFAYNHLDHTKGVRELFGQGSETLNAEASYLGKRFEATLTRVFGSDVSLDVGTRPTVRPTDERDGWTGKLTLFATRGIQLGGSYAHLSDGRTERTSTGVHGFMGNERLWVLVDHQWHADGERALYVAGSELTRGLWIKVERDYREAGVSQTFATLHLFPRPHFDFLLSTSGDTHLLVSHFAL